MAYALPRVWSLWIYDRHCNLVYHRDWSSAHFAASGASNAQGAAGAASNDVSRAPGSTLLPGTSRAAPKGSGASQPAPGPSNNSLPLDEEAKLVYGVVFSLRNMARKLGGPRESFNGYSTSSYTLSHLQTPTMYTFVLITDPATSPSGGASRTNSLDGSLLRSSTGAALAGSTGGQGQTLQNVLLQIWKGPWIEYVARNPASEALEREESEDFDAGEDEDDDDEMDSEGDEEAKEKKAKVAGGKEQKEGHVVGQGNERVVRRMGIDCDALRDGIERVLTQNKLFAPPTAA